VIGGNNAKEAAMRKHRCGVNVDSKNLLQLQLWISKNNLYAKFYRTVNQELPSNPAATFVLKALNDPSNNPNTYNEPRVEEIGFVLDTFEEEKISPRDMVLHKLNGGIKRVTDLFPGYGPKLVTSCESLGIGLLCEEDESRTVNVVNKILVKKHLSKNLLSIFLVYGCYLFKSCVLYKLMSLVHMLKRGASHVIP
jgi:hypothetical protein